MNKVAIILSGCGNRDGSELQETLSLFLSLDRRDIEYQCFAPHTPFHVVSYTTDEGETGEVRQLFDEAARIARGNILPIENYNPSDYDALLFPGGMGAARNLSSYAFKGADMEVLPAVQTAIDNTYAQSKPICAMCIAPMILAKALGNKSVRITLGGENEASKIANHLGALTQICGPTDVCVDVINKVITTPSYMAATRISEIFDGADNLVEHLTRWLR